MKRLWCFNRQDFNNLCENNNWTSQNYPENSAFISICNRIEGDFLFVDEITHHFKEETNEIINLNFDDITQDIAEIHGIILKGISDTDALRLAEFIDSNIGKDFYVHCEGGISRSQGVVRYIQDVYGEDNFETRKDNPCRTPNLYVTAKLKRAYMKLKNIEYI